MTELFDALVLDLYRDALVDLHEDHEDGLATQIALVATAVMAAPTSRPIPTST